MDYKKVNLIGVSGRIKNGKDLVGEIINYLSVSSNPNFEDFKKLKDGDNLTGRYQIKKFADKLKECVCLLIGCSREQLENQEFKNTELGEEWRIYWNDNSFTPKSKIYASEKELKNSYEWEKDPFKGKIIKTEILTPRKILQILGTEGGRRLIHPNIWCNALFSNYRSGYIEQGVGFIETDNDFPNWLITDVRFPDNEGAAISNREGILIGVRRHFHLRFPEYSYLVDKLNPYDVPLELENVDPELWETLHHDSETSMGDYSWCDVVIHNNSSMEELFNKVRNINKIIY